MLKNMASILSVTFTEGDANPTKILGALSVNTGNVSLIIRGGIVYQRTFGDTWHFKVGSIALPNLI